jgi:hypothetical protein
MTKRKYKDAFDFNWEHSEGFRNFTDRKPIDALDARARRLEYMSDQYNDRYGRNTWRSVNRRWRSEDLNDKAKARRRRAVMAYAAETTRIAREQRQREAEREEQQRLRAIEDYRDKVPRTDRIVATGGIHWGRSREYPEEIVDFDE